MKTTRISARITRELGRGCALLALASASIPVTGAVFTSNSAAYAQATARFSRIDVSGNQRIASDTVRAIAGISAATRVTPAQINGAVQNLYDSGLFETVDVRPERGRLVIDVVEYPTINNQTPTNHQQSQTHNQNPQNHNTHHNQQPQLHNHP